MSGTNSGLNLRLKRRTPDLIEANTLEGSHTLVREKSLWRAAAAAKPANDGQNDRWPPGIMLLFAGCLSFLLWAAIIAALMWAHRALGWF